MYLLGTPLEMSVKDKKFLLAFVTLLKETIIIYLNPFALCAASITQAFFFFK
jgi:hypothetical protein